MGRTLGLRTKDEDIEHELLAVNSDAESVVNEIVETRVPAAGLAADTVLNHDVARNAEDCS